MRQLTLDDFMDDMPEPIQVEQEKTVSYPEWLIGDYVQVMSWEQYKQAGGSVMDIEMECYLDIYAGMKGRVVATPEPHYVELQLDKKLDRPILIEADALNFIR